MLHLLSSTAQAPQKRRADFRVLESAVLLREHISSNLSSSLGLAVLASLAAWRTDEMVASAAYPLDAAAGGR